MNINIKDAGNQNDINKLTTWLAIKLSRQQHAITVTNVTVAKICIIIRAYFHIFCHKILEQKLFELQTSGVIKRIKPTTANNLMQLLWFHINGSRQHINLQQFNILQQLQWPMWSTLPQVNTKYYYIRNAQSFVIIQNQTDTIWSQNAFYDLRSKKHSCGSNATILDTAT